MSEIKTYPKMNETAKDLLRRSKEPMNLYILARIEELEKQVEDLTQPPNTPITLDELREIEGKPVPVWCDKANGYIFIATTKTEPYNQVWYFNYKGFSDTVLYYSTKFYRRKPEEGMT